MVGFLGRVLHGQGENIPFGLKMMLQELPEPVQQAVQGVAQGYEVERASFLGIEPAVLPRLSVGNGNHHAGNGSNPVPTAVRNAGRPPADFTRGLAKL